MLEVNAHIHLPPNFSAFDSVSQAVGLAATEGVRVLGASNYYDYTVYREFAAEAQRQEIFPLYGIEVIALDDDLLRAGTKANDPGNPGKVYVCGKGIARFDPMPDEACALIQVIRDKDSARMTRMIEKMAGLFAKAGLNTELDEARVKSGVVHRHNCPTESVYLQERHVAQAFQEAVFGRLVGGERAEFLSNLFGTPAKNPEDANGVQNEIRSHLMKAGKPAYIEETFVDFNHARRMVLALGGVPCYPVLADGARPICEFEEPVEVLIDRIHERGLFCAEFIPVRNSAEVLSRYVRAMRAAGLVVTAGTEHNTRDLLPLAPTCAGGEPIPGDVAEIFREGICVIAAHQEQVARGEAGYVDDAGALNAAYTSDEERIVAFRAAGEAVLQNYFQRASE